jgi:hypothetical protein
VTLTYDYDTDETRCDHCGCATPRLSPTGVDLCDDCYAMLQALQPEPIVVVVTLVKLDSDDSEDRRDNRREKYDDDGLEYADPRDARAERDWG